VSCLRFNRSGGLLASGGRDTDVIVWDVAAEAGLYRLKGHRDAVTDVAFVERGGRLISGSKDTHVRVWELATQHCCQTLVGHRCEVWALDVDAAERRLVTGAADAQLRVFALVDDEQGALPAAADGALLAAMGALARPGTDRVAALRFAPASAGGAASGVLAVAPAGRLVELWEVHAPEEARRRMKRRKKRKRDKADTKAAALAAAGGAAAADAADAADADADPAPADADAETPVATDEFTLLATLPLKAKALALAFAPAPRGSALASLALTLANNAVEAYDLMPAGVPGGAAEEATLKRTGDVLAAGHRADVRAVALASDDSLLLSTSHAGAKARARALRAWVLFLPLCSVLRVGGLWWGATGHVFSAGGRNIPCALFFSGLLACHIKDGSVSPSPLSVARRLLPAPASVPGDHSSPPFLTHPFAFAYA
jgi:U3 small nucleolar RNA-associated protein 12